MFPGATICHWILRHACEHPLTIENEKQIQEMSELLGGLAISGCGCVGGDWSLHSWVQVQTGRNPLAGQGFLYPVSCGVPVRPRY